jgi:protein-disulfide isomerase
MRRFLPFAIIIFVALLTLTGATLLYRAKRPTPLIMPEKRADAPGKDVHARGPANAAVTLEEFGDFECPPCGILSLPLDQMEHDLAPNVRLIFRHFPLSTQHKNALPAALAAEAAGMQGRFWEMHDVLYKEQPAWSKAPNALELIQSYAGILGLDMERFKKDMADPKIAERVEQDQKNGVDLGVKNTPTVFLNGKEVPPTSLNPPILRKLVEDAVKEKSTH